MKVKKRKEKEKKLLTIQIMKKSSALYDSIQKDYNLLNQVCLICLTRDKTQILNEDNEDSEDYENDEDYEEDYKISDNIINTNKNVTIDFIDDINNNKYTSFYKYIDPDCCKHFYHKKCKKSLDLHACRFCQLFITSINMQRFGCFISKQYFKDLLKGIIDDSINIESRRIYIIRDIEKIFYSQIENSLTIDKDKKDKILQLKRINDKYIEKYRLLKKGRDHLNYFRYYLLPINKDLTYEEGELENEVYAQEKK